MISTSVDWGALSPVIVLFGAAILAITFGSFVNPARKQAVGLFFSILGGLGSFLACCLLWIHIDNEGAVDTIAGTVRVDQMGLFITAIIAAAVFFSSLLVKDYMKREKLPGGLEVYSLILLAAVGGSVMATANDLIVLFMGLEALSIAAYVLAAAHIRRAESQESGMKYFVMGAFSSAFFLYGVALIYGATGSTKLGQIAEKLDLADAASDNALLLAGIALFLVGLLFKVSAVPFHAWTPDVYEGAPSPFVAFMASAVKAAGFVALIRVLGGALISRADDWQPIIYAVAIASMAVGSLAAIVQTNVKRMLAYSSISHAGYILVGIQAANADGFAASLWYLAAYAMLALGSFMVTTICGGDFSLSSEDHHIDNYRGLVSRRPFIAVIFALLLLAQTGIPPTSGFFAKFSVISAAVDGRSYPLAIVAMIFAVVAAFIYLRLLVVMFFQPGPDEKSFPSQSSKRRLSRPTAQALIVIALFTLAMGIYPDPLLDLATSAAQTLV